MRITIKNKLLIVLLLANGLLAMGLYTLATQRIDKEFLGYLHKKQNQKLEPFVTALAKQYSKHGDWQWLSPRSREWRDLIRQYITDASQSHDQGEPPHHLPDRTNRYPHPADGGNRPERFPPPVRRYNEQGPLNLDMHFLVRDNNKQLIIGLADSGKKARWLPIRYQNQQFGELGVVTVPGATESMNDVFVQKQKRLMAYIVLGLLFSAIIISLALARHFQRPIIRIIQGIDRLVSGNYSPIEGVDSSDEFGQLARNLNLLSRTLKENQESRRQWIADISHELRTPISIMQGELHALADGVRELNKDAILSLQQDAQQLNKLIGDLHELSLSDLGALAYNKQPLDLTKLLDQFIADIKTTASDIKLTIYSQLSENSLIVFADDERLYQLFNNLFQNTVRYTDMPGKLTVILKRIDKMAVIFWEDSAPGISDTDLPRLFDRLYRVDKSRSRAKGGSGLGMSICQNIIDAHDGEVSLEHSALGGLKIRIALPLIKS